MLKYKILLIFLFFNYTAVNAKQSTSIEKLCKSVPKWEHFSDVRKVPGIAIYKKIKLAQVIAPEFLIDKIDKKGWMVIDARDKITRKVFGIVVDTFLLTSDPHQTKMNEFSEKKILKVLSTENNIKKLTKRGIPKIDKISDLSKIKFVLFCNGYSCHRSTWAACELHKLKVPYENIYILLSGFSSLLNFKENIK